jgi:hypothetical protein
MWCLRHSDKDRSSSDKLQWARAALSFGKEARLAGTHELMLSAFAPLEDRAMAFASSGRLPRLQKAFPKSLAALEVRLPML